MKQVAARKVVHAQDQGSPQTSSPGADAAPDRTELLRRPEHGLGVFESSLKLRPAVAGDRRLGGSPSGCGSAAESGSRAKAEPPGGARLCLRSRRIAAA